MGILESSFTSVGHCHHSEKHISNNMKVILSIFGLVGLTMAMPHLQEPKNARSVNEMIDAVESGMASPEDPHEVLDADLVVDSDVELESGSLTWKEVAIDGRSRSSCARSDHGNEKRARIIALANEVVTLSLTSTSTITSTAATTKTFSVSVSCTTAGFSFGVSMC